MTMANTVNEVQGVGGTATWIDLITHETKASIHGGATRIRQGTRIAGTNWVLAFDLGIDLEFTERSVVAASPWVNDYGQGPNQFEATQDLLASLADYRESLERRAQQGNLSDDLGETLSRLQILLVTE